MPCSQNFWKYIPKGESKMEKGNRLRALRLQKQMTTGELAKLTGLSASTISKYERCEILKVPDDILGKLANAFGISQAALQGKHSTTPEDGNSNYILTVRKTIAVDVNIPLSANDVFTWLFNCTDPGTLRYLGKTALRFAADLESPETDDFRSRA